MAREVSEDQIRQRAHEIWEREGRQEGSHDAHWQRATEELLQEDLAGNPVKLDSDPPNDHVGLSGTTAAGGAPSADSGADE